MQKSGHLELILALLLCLSPIRATAAQDATDCDQLRGSIGRLEQMDINAMPASLRQLYKESLFTLYTQLSQCLERELSAATEMQRAVAGTAAASGVADKLRALTKEKSDLDGKLEILRASLNPGPAAPTAAAPAAAAAAPSTVAPAAQRLTPRQRRQAARATSTSGRAAALAAVTRSVTPDCTSIAAYDAPGILQDLAARLAADIVRTNTPDIAAQAGPQMVLYTVFDAASARSSQLVRGLEAYHYLGETARTDKQLGASPKSEGAVSAIERPGFAQLLGLAIEHGAITKQNDGTNLTLSTSLYSLYAAAKKDTAENYNRAGVLNRVGVSATFAADDKEDELANARRNNLSEWSAKVRVFGDRSTRSSRFQRVFNDRIKPIIRDRLRTLSSSIEALADANPDVYEALEQAALDNLPNLVQARMQCADYTSAATNAAKEKIISDLILGQLRTTVYDPLHSGSFTLGAEAVRRIEAEFLPNLKRSLDNLLLADDVLKKAIDDLEKSPLGTFAYTNHRQPNASDYSETKLLFEQDKSFVRPLKLTGNFGLSFYHRPDRAMNQQTLRDVSAALSFEGTSASPFTEDENMSKITYSFVGRYQRMFENRRMANRKPDIANAQFLVEIPFLKGFSLPFSLSYANATEEERKKNVKFNFGMRLDTDKLFAMLNPTPER